MWKLAGPDFLCALAREKFQDVSLLCATFIYLPRDPCNKEYLKNSILKAQTARVHLAFSCITRFDLLNLSSSRSSIGLLLCH
jgi:hypothetical protein